MPLFFLIWPITEISLAFWRNWSQVDLSNFNDFFILNFFFRLCNGLQLLQLLETLLPFWEEFHVCHPVVNTTSQSTQPTSVCTEKRMISKFRPQLWWDYFFCHIKVRKLDMYTMDRQWCQRKRRPGKNSRCLYSKA